MYDLFSSVLSDEKENKAEKMDITPAADEKKGNSRFVRVLLFIKYNSILKSDIRF